MRIKTSRKNPYRLDVASQLTQAVYATFRRMPGAPRVRTYNLTICNEKRFLWYRVAKVCTRTIYNHLKEHCRLDAEHPFDIYYQPSSYRHHFKFAFARNPWDRLVSCWKNKVLGAKNHFGLDKAARERMKDVAEFVDWVGTLNLDRCDIHLRRQTSLIDLDEVDFLGRFEMFAEDYAEVCERLSIPAGFGHRNRSTDSRDFEEFYTEALAAKVAALYEPDIRVLGYAGKGPGESSGRRGP